MTLRLSRRFIPWVFHHAVEFKWYYLGAVGCLYLLQLFQVELPERIRLLTLDLSSSSFQSASIWIFMGLALGILLFRTFSRLLFFYPARVQQKLLRMELLDLLEAHPPERYQGRSQGQIFQILFDDINNLRAFIGFGLLQIGNLLITAWVLIPKFNQTDAYLWPAFIPLFLSVIFFSFMTMFNQKVFKKMMDKKGEVQQFIIEAHGAKQTIKNFHREENFIQGFLKISGQELSLFFKSALGYAFTGPYVKLGLGASLLWGAMLIQAKGKTPSDLVYFSGFLYLFLEPVMFLSWVAVVISQGLAAWKRVKELYTDLITASSFEEELKKFPLHFNKNSLNVELPFWNQKLAVHLALHRWTAIIAETGAGKSVLLSRLATSLILSGKKISMVQQEPYLFNDTIGGNIFLGREESPLERMKALELIKIFQLESLAEKLEDILNIEVGENGKRLSGGQIKRVALIRSLMSGSDFIIWDDPFSSIDIILEKRIMQLLREDARFKEFTFIISSHRLTTVRLVDEIIHLEKNQGIIMNASVDQALKEPNVVQFFKEQFVEAPLA